MREDVYQLIRANKDYNFNSDDLDQREDFSIGL